MFLDAHRDVFDLEEQGENIQDESQSDHAQHRSKPKISSLAAVHHQRWCVAEEWTGTLGHKCGLHFEGFTQVGIHSLGQSSRVAMDP